MEAYPVRALLKRLISHTRHLHSRLGRRWDIDSTETGESIVYKHTLKFQRPTTIDYEDIPINNSASFIGRIAYPLKVIEPRCGGLGVHTVLNVANSSPSSTRSFMVDMIMWDEMADMSMQHLKPNDFVYVWGRLESYSKADHNGNSKLFYEIVVKEINYVASNNLGANFPESKRLEFSAEDRMEKYKNKLHLWQIFLSSPHEWRDCRKSKKNPRHPDFKHKDTGEALWLHPQDPPWIKGQLQLLDARMAEQGLQDYYGTSSSDLSPIVYDDSGNK